MEPELTDEEIAVKIQNGDKEIFGVLVERFEEKLLRYGKKFLSGREDVEDLVQDVFVNVYQNIQSYNSAYRFSPWIYRIAHNMFVSGLRKHTKSPLSLPDFDTLVSHRAYEDPAEYERERSDMRRMIDKGLAALSPKYREILILYYLEEMAYREIAEILEVPTGTVSIRLKRAKEELRKIYQKLDMEYGT